MRNNNISASSVSASASTMSALDEIYQRMVQNYAYQRWRQNYKHCLKMYAGLHAFSESCEQEFRQRDIEGVTINIIAPIVNTLCGVEIQNRFRIKAVIDDSSENAAMLTEAINAYLLSVQNTMGCDQEFAYTLQDAVIGGLGWFYVGYRDHRPYLEHVDPLSIVFDTSDYTKNFKKQERIFRIHLWNTSEIKSRFKEKAKGLWFDEDEFNNLNDLRTLDESLYSNITHRVIECVEKRIVHGYRGYRESDGVMVETINKRDTGELVDVKPADLSVCYRTWICQGEIMRANVIRPTIINHEELPYIPMVYQKDIHNLPRGLVSQIDDLQQNVNAILSKHSAYLNSEKIFVKTENPNVKMEILSRPNALQNPNAVLVLGKDDQVISLRASEATMQYTQALGNYMDLIKRASGVEDESRGIPTNANSGIAQQLRDNMSLRTNGFIFDNFRLFKKRIGLMLIKQLQASYRKNIIVEIGEEENKYAFILNWSIPQRDGTFKILNDISVTPFDIVVEEIPVYSRSTEARRLEFERIMQLPFADILWQSEKLLGMYVDNPKKVKEEIMQARIMLAKTQQPTR